MLYRASRALLVLALLGAAAACGGPARMPTGPAPEYEDPPTPSWMKDGGTPAPAPPDKDAGLPSS